MKKRNSLYYLLVLLLLAGCSGEEFTEAPNPTPQAGDKIAFNIGFAPQMQTRVATDANFTSTWEVGDEIGIFAVKRGSSETKGLATTGNYMHNVRLVLQGNGTWLPDTDLWYASGSDVLDIYTYYPYDVNATDPTNITFAVQADQRGAAYNKSDLLTAKVTNIEKSSNVVNLQFSHALALIQVKIGKEVNVPALDGGFTVTLKAVHTQATFDWTNATATDITTDITMHKVANMDDTYRALVPAQSIAQGEQLFTFVQTTTGKDFSFVYKTAVETKLETAKATQHKMTIGWGIDPDWQYAIGDTYPHKGRAIGLVYEISNGGKNGKIVSLDEEKNGWSWDSPYTATGATDQDNGMINIRKVYEFRPGFGNHPPFEFANSINQKYGITTDNYSNPNAKGIWYPPALNELKAIYDVYNADKSTFNSKLTVAGGTALKDRGYWSSSENAASYAWLMHFSDGNALNPIKDSSHSVRAVSAF